MQPTLSLSYKAVKPGSCPNPVNPRSKGVVPMAVVGSESFDITQVDHATLTLRRGDGVGGVVTPLQGPRGPGIETADVATPFESDLCDCHELGGDGIDDLTLKFSTRELEGAFELSELLSGTSTMLTLSGLLLDGRAYEASDCMVIPCKPARSGQRGSRKREVISNCGHQQPGSARHNAGSTLVLRCGGVDRLSHHAEAARSRRNAVRGNDGYRHLDLKI